MALQPVPSKPVIRDFPALSERALGTYNQSAYVWGSQMPGFGDGMHALADNTHHNAQESRTAGEAATAAAGAAVPAAAAAVEARNGAVAAFDSFDARYLGQKAADPTTDNAGGALVAGALYFRTSGPAGMRVWDGAKWEYGYLPAGAYLLQDFSTLTTASNIAGTEVVALSGGLKSTLSAIFAWFKAQANSWTSLQTFMDLRETMVTANTGTAYTINTANGTLYDLTLTGNVTYTFPAAAAGKQFTILAKQDGTGSRASTFPANVRWASGATPLPTATAGRTDVWSFVADGTYWLGFVGGFNYQRA